MHSLHNEQSRGRATVALFLPVFHFCKSNQFAAKVLRFHQNLLLLLKSKYVKTFEGNLEGFYFTLAHVFNVKNFLGADFYEFFGMFTLEFL